MRKLFVISSLSLSKIIMSMNFSMKSAEPFQSETFFFPFCSDRGWLELNSRCELLNHFQPAGRKPGGAPQFSHVRPDLGRLPVLCSGRVELLGRLPGSVWPFRDGLVQSRDCLTLLMHRIGPPDDGRISDSTEEAVTRTTIPLNTTTPKGQ